MRPSLEAEFPSGVRDSRGRGMGIPHDDVQLFEEATMKEWSKPTFSEVRWGFEVMMYIANR